jgi:DNA-binding transcriptional regulator of glucitol operon
MTRPIALTIGAVCGAALAWLQSSGFEDTAKASGRLVGGALAGMLVAWLIHRLTGGRR